MRILLTAAHRSRSSVVSTLTGTARSPFAIRTLTSFTIARKLFSMTSGGRGLPSNATTSTAYIQSEAITRSLRELESVGGNTAEKRSHSRCGIRVLKKGWRAACRNQRPNASRCLGLGLGATRGTYLSVSCPGISLVCGSEISNSSGKTSL